MQEARTDADASAAYHKEGPGYVDPPPKPWFKRNPKTVITLGVAVCACVILAVVLPIVLVGGSGQQNVAYPTVMDGKLPPQQAEFPSPTSGSFDDSARANEFTPPLNEPFQYGRDPVRGINLGGWLVIEPFITPSLFDRFKPQDNVIDEWTLCEKLGPEEAAKTLESHYKTFITEDDFKKIKEMGFNHVRIPVGHWAVNVVEGEPYVPKISWKYLLQGIQWARKYGLRAMVELHTAPGSQNGWNHSGRYGQVGWLNGTAGEANAKRTLEILESMITFFNQSEWAKVTPIFGVLNEPAIHLIEAAPVKAWYQKSHDVIRNITGPKAGPMLTYHDGFLGVDSWRGFFKDYDRSILETHMYLIFDDGLVALPHEQQASFPCTAWRELLTKSTQAGELTMVGEFSLATNDCGKYLNGVGLGTRFEGTYKDQGKRVGCPDCTCAKIEDWKSWDDNYKKFLNSFVEHQMDAFEKGGMGWFFWTYKTEAHINPHWDYLLGWEQGWNPKTVNKRHYTCEEPSGH